MEKGDYKNWEGAQIKTVSYWIQGTLLGKKIIKHGHQAV
jgi:hypothetical protein